MRIGFGYDIHRLIKNRDLLLGGVKLESLLGESGHSDGDVLIHALIDALLGASGLGDIGSLFPDTDPDLKNVSSRILLKRVSSLLQEKKIEIINIDSSIILEKPKINPYIDLIKENLVNDLGIKKKLISVKGKTKEGLDSTGNNQAVEAYVSVLIDKK